MILRYKEYQNTTCIIFNKIVKLANNQTVRNGTLFTVFSFLNSGVNFILLILIAGYIDPQGYGHLNLFNTALNLFGYFICLNTTGAIAVNFFRNTETELKKTISAVFLITFLCYALLSCSVIIMHEQIEKLFGLSVLLQLAALTLCLFEVFTKTALDIWRIEEKVINYGIFSVSKVLLNFIITIVCVIFFQLDWYGQIISYVSVGCVFFVISIVSLVRKKYLTTILPDINNYKDILSFGIPLIPHNASFWLRQGLDRIILNVYQSTSIVGLFSFSMNFANIIQIIGSSFNATNSVFIYKNLKNDDESIRYKLRKQSILMIGIYCSLGIIVCIGCYVFIPIFYPKYSGCTLFLVCQCAGAVCQCIYLLFVNFLFYYKKTKVLMYITFSISVAHAALSFWLTRYGAELTAIIGLVSNFAIMLGVYIYSRRVYKII